MMAFLPAVLHVLLVHVVLLVSWISTSSGFSTGIIIITRRRSSTTTSRFGLFLPHDSSSSSSSTLSSKKQQRQQRRRLPRFSSRISSARQASSTSNVDGDGDGDSVQSPTRSTSNTATTAGSTTTSTRNTKGPQTQTTTTTTTNKIKPNAKRKGGGGNNNNNNNNNSINNSNKRFSSVVSKRTTWSPGQNRKLNQGIVQQETAMDLLTFLASQKGALTLSGSGGILNSVNYSTAFHRIARHVQNNHQNQNQNQNHNNNNNNNNYQNQNMDPATMQEKNDRSKVLTDPRFALLMCSAAEAMLGKVQTEGSSSSSSSQQQQQQQHDSSFGAREMSNIAWAIAKLKLTPPQNVMPLETTSDDLEARVLECSQQVRSLIYQVAKERKNTGTSAAAAPWIPKLSELSALLLDTISHRVVGVVNPNLFRLQEWANLLWALATTGRADPQVFAFIIGSLMHGMDQEISMAAEPNNNDKPTPSSSTATRTDDKDAQVLLRPQEWSNSLWALATSGILGPEEDFLPFMAKIMESNPTFLESFKPQELSNTIWGVATIVNRRPGQPSGPLNDAALTIFRHVSRQVIARRGERFKSQELTNTAWALATLGFGTMNIDLELAERSDYKVLNSDDVEGDAKLARQLLGIVFQNAKDMLRRYRSQELNNLCWIMARVDRGDAELTKMIAIELSNPRRNVASQDIGTTIWGMASSGFDQPDFYRAIVSRWNPEMAARAKPQELSNSVWALATADVAAKYPDVFDTTILPPEQRGTPNSRDADPVIACFALAAQELMRRPQQFKAQEIKDILWAFSRNGIRHPMLFRAMAEYLVGDDGKDGAAPGRGLDGFSVQAVGNTAWAYARQAQLGADTIQRFKGKTNMPRSSGRLAHYMVLFTDVSESLIHKLFYAIAETDLNSFDNLKKMKPQDVANTAWAFATVGLQHTKFLDAVAVELERRSRAFTPQEMTNALWALATLDYCPKNLLHKLEHSIVTLQRQRSDPNFWSTRSIARVWKRQELANLAWIIAVFGEFPMDLVKMVYMGLIGVGDDPTPEMVAECHVSAGLGPDDGISPTVVMSLTYLQMMMDLDTSSSFSSPEDRIHLPADFPDGWVLERGSTPQVQPSRTGTQTTVEAESLLNKQENAGDLQLNRSGLQQVVSAALNRIGFSHVEEYVFDMTTLSKDYNILNAGATTNDSQMSSEILSLDMANVEQRIGIEVDGPGHFISNIDNLEVSDDQYHKESTIYKSSSSGKVEVVFGWNGKSKRIATKRNGPTALKLRLMQALGWKIHNIPFWEWATVDQDTAAEDAYCHSLLED